MTSCILSTEVSLHWKINHSAAVKRRNMLQLFYSVDTNLEFDEALEIARNYDLSQHNPDPENITVFEPLTEEEIQERRQRNEELGGGEGVIVAPPRNEESEKIMITSRRVESNPTMI